MKIILYIWAALIAISIGLTAKQAMAQPIVTESTSKSETKVESPPPSAISPNITTINNKNCSTGISGATQTQILGISFGATVKDSNCEMIVKAESLFMMQMKTAAVSVMCQDSAIWWGMWDAGTYCPVEGKVGVEAKNYWLNNSAMIPDRPKIK
jgi:hypothetical protein